MAGKCSHPDSFPPLPDEEESDGDTHLFGPGSSSGYGHVDDMYIVRLGRSSWLGYSGERTIYWDFTDLHNLGVTQSLRFRETECREHLAPVDQSV